MKYQFILLAILFGMISCSNDPKSTKNPKTITELNNSEISSGERVIVIRGGTLIDGTGADPVKNSQIVIRGNVIERISDSEGDIPEEATVIDAKGKWVLPGLIDAHFHNEESKTIAPLFLTRGITSVRDPGAWNHVYDSARLSGSPMPRLFLTGPHIDMFPPAYPDNCFTVRDPEEGRRAVEMFCSQGATAIKVYFRLPISIIREVCNTAHENGVPVTGHLEIANARDAINAGLDGIEHITSFGTALLPPFEAEQFKQKVLADNSARNRGRYEAWASINLENNQAVDSLLDFLVDKETFISSTLAVFERRADRGDSIEVNGFANMLKFAGMAAKHGAKMVIGSHTWVPYADLGFAYFREMELHNESGLSPMQVIQAATIENARFLRVDERLGSLEEGKLADLIIVDADPLADIRSMRKVSRVMLNGVWIESQPQ